MSWSGFVSVGVFVCLFGWMFDLFCISLQGYVHHQTLPFEIDISSFVTIKEASLRWSLSQNEWLIRNPAGIPDDPCIHHMEDRCIPCGCLRSLAKEPWTQSGISWKIRKIISSSWHDGGFAHTITQAEGGEQGDPPAASIVFLGPTVGAHLPAVLTDRSYCDPCGTTSTRWSTPCTYFRPSWPGTLPAQYMQNDENRCVIRLDMTGLDENEWHLFQTCLHMKPKARLIAHLLGVLVILKDWRFQAVCKTVLWPIVSLKT